MTPTPEQLRDAELIKELYDKFIDSKGITLRNNYLAANEWFIKKHHINWKHCLEGKEVER